MNKFILQRSYYNDSYTIGRLSFDGEYLCDTLEPPSLHLSQTDDTQKILNAKQQGYRAIPQGVYELAITYSPRFRQRLPLLLNVPCFEGIRIHAGNYPRDAQGCVLPGWNTKKGMVTGSREALARIMAKIQSYSRKDEGVSIEVREPAFQKKEKGKAKFV